MSRKPVHRPAFTLLELLIVLAIVVALTSMGLPSLQRMYAQSRLKAAAQELQGELHRTRLTAMKSGKAFVFRYLPGCSSYEILSREEFERREKNREGLGAVAIGPDLFDSNSSEKTMQSPQQLLPPTSVKSLPQNINFAPTIGSLSNVWSSPVLFYPNGRTSQASLTLQIHGRYSFRQTLVLRGLTGTVSNE